MTAIAADERIATPRAATEKAARSKRVNDLHARRTRLLEEVAICPCQSRSQCQRVC